MDWSSFFAGFLICYVLGWVHEKVLGKSWQYCNPKKKST